MGYDTEGGNGGSWDAMQRGQKADLNLISKTEQKYGAQEACEIIVRILRRIHDPNKLKAFEKDLALVAVGAENLDWLKKEYLL